MKIKPCKQWYKYYWYRKYKRVFYPNRAPEKPKRVRYAL